LRRPTSSSSLVFSAHLQQAFLTQQPQRAQHRVGVDAEHAGELLRLGDALARPRLALDDGPADLRRHLLVQVGGIPAVDLPEPQRGRGRPVAARERAARPVGGRCTTAPRRAHDDIHTSAIEPPAPSHTRPARGAGSRVTEQPARSDHICYLVGDGFTVVDVWEHETSFDAFGPIIGPALAGAGLDPRPRIYRIEATMGADGKHAVYSAQS
jgi:hypothetical protein